MADNKITVGLELEDDLTPKINQVKGALEDLGKTSSGVKMGESERGGGFMGEQLKELTAGIGYQFGLWNLGFMAAQKMGDALGEVINDMQVFSQLSNRMAGSNQNAAASFVQLAGAALASGTAISETAKRVDELMSVGMTRERATQLAASIQQLRSYTGIDITAATKAAEMLRLSPEQALTMSLGGGPFARLGPEARAAQREEAERPYREQALREGQNVEKRLFQDRTHNTERLMELGNRQRSQEMEDRQRMEDHAIQDAHFRINTQVEETNRAINREMEMRHLVANQDLEDRHRVISEAIEDTHRAISQEMEDRHRMQSQAMEDQDRLHSRQIAIASGIRGVTQAAFRETVFGGSAGGGPLGGAIDKIAAEMEKGYAQLEKDMGISRGQAQRLIGAGAMSPQVLLQEAQAAREEQRIQERREMEIESIMTERKLQIESIMEERKERLESIQQERKQQMESINERNRQEDQIHQMQVDFHNQEVVQSRQHAQARLDLEREIAAEQMGHNEEVYQEQLKLTRSYEDTLLVMESDRVAAQLKRSLAAIDAEEEYAKGAFQRAADSMREIILATIGITLPRGAAAKPPAAAANGQGLATDASIQQLAGILDNIGSKLDRVLTGG